MKKLQGLTNPKVEGFALLLLNRVPQIVSLYHSSVEAWQSHSSCLSCVALVDPAFETL